jgi:hypothetical protein
VWNMSGPIFSGKENSSRYTGVNVVLAGLRGIIGPSMGGCFLLLSGPMEVLWIGGLFCFYSGLLLYTTREKESISS